MGTLMEVIPKKFGSFFSSGFAIPAGILTLALTLCLFWPSLHVPFEGEDQLGFFLEMNRPANFQEKALLIFDYSENRYYHKGDTALFRPLLILWLAIQYGLFSYHYMAWHGMNVVLHLVILYLLYRVLRAQGPPWAAAVIVLCFAVREPTGYMVKNYHHGGYLWAFGLFLLAFRTMQTLVCEAKVSRKTMAVYLSALVAGCFFYEMILVFSVLMAGYILWERRRKFGTDSVWFTLGLFFPALLFLGVFIPRTLLLSRPMLFGEEDSLRGLFTFERFSTMFVNAWDGLKLYVALFFPWELPQRYRLLAILGVPFLFLPALNRPFFRERLPRLVLIFGMFVSYILILTLIRQSCARYYFYMGYLLLFLLAHSAVDWKRLTGIRAVLPGILLMVVFGYSLTRCWLFMQNDPMYPTEAHPYFSAINRFVDQHKNEKGFSFRLENPPDLDQPFSTNVGYINSGAPFLEKRISEIVYASFYQKESPRYRLRVSTDGRLDVLRHEDVK